MEIRKPKLVKRNEISRIEPAPKQKSFEKNLKGMEEETKESKNLNQKCPTQSNSNEEHTERNRDMNVLRICKSKFYNNYRQF